MTRKADAAEMASDKSVLVAAAAAYRLEPKKCTHAQLAKAQKAIAKYQMTYTPSSLGEALKLISRLREAYIWAEKESKSREQTIKEMIDRENYRDKLIEKLRKGGKSKDAYKVDPKLIKDLEDLGVRLEKLEKHIKDKQEGTFKIGSPEPHTEPVDHWVDAQGTFKIGSPEPTGAEMNQRVYNGECTSCGQPLSAKEKKRGFKICARCAAVIGKTPEKIQQEECPDCGAKTPNPLNSGELECSNCKETFYINAEPLQPEIQKVPENVEVPENPMLAGIEVVRDKCKHSDAPFRIFKQKVLQTFNTKAEQEEIVKAIHKAGYGHRGQTITAALADFHNESQKTEEDPAKSVVKKVKKEQIKKVERTREEGYNAYQGDASKKLDQPHISEKKYTIDEIVATPIYTYTADPIDKNGNTRICGNCGSSRIDWTEIVMYQWKGKEGGAEYLQKAKFGNGHKGYQNIGFFQCATCHAFLIGEENVPFTKLQKRPDGAYVSIYTQEKVAPAQTAPPATKGEDRKARESATRLRCGKPCRHGRDAHDGEDHSGPCKICGVKKCPAFRPVGPAGKAWREKHEKTPVGKKSSYSVWTECAKHDHGTVTDDVREGIVSSFKHEIEESNRGRKGHTCQIFPGRRDNKRAIGLINNELDKLVAKGVIVDAKYKGNGETPLRNVVLAAEYRSANGLQKLKEALQK